MPRFELNQRVWYMNNGIPAQTSITAVFDLGCTILYSTSDYNGMYNMGVQEHDLFNSQEALLADYELRDANLLM